MVTTWNRDLLESINNGDWEKGFPRQADVAQFIQDTLRIFTLLWTESNPEGFVVSIPLTAYKKDVLHPLRDQLTYVKVSF